MGRKYRGWNCGCDGCVGDVDVYGLTRESEREGFFDSDDNSLACFDGAASECG